jgi:alkyl hydroperoxide reductase subunit AhpC
VGNSLLTPERLYPGLHDRIGDRRQDYAGFQKAGRESHCRQRRSIDSHKGWINDINETQKTTMNYPIIVDPEKKVAPCTT